MRLYLKKQTDAEVVDGVRKMVRASKWIAVLQLVIAAIILTGLLPTLISTLLDIMRELPQQDRFRGWSGFATGATVGLAFALMAALAILFALQAFNNLLGERKNRLLIKYYDESQIKPEKKKDVEPAPPAGRGETPRH